MGRFVLRRLALAVPALLLISLALFLIIEAAPGDPLADMPLTIPPETRARIREALGLGEPWHLRYLLWLRNLFVTEPLYWLDRWLGTDWAAGQARILSWQSRAPVFDIIAERLPQTLLVVGGGLAGGIALGVPIALIAAWRPHSWADQIGTIVTMAGYSLPTFVTAVVLIVIFAGWVPADSVFHLPTIYDTTLQVTDWPSLVERLRQMVLPVAVLALHHAGQISRYLRAGLLDNLGRDYVRAARAKGLGPARVLLVHVLRNSLIPVVTVIALLIPGVFTGAIITETIFRINGIGQLLLLAMQGNDAPMVLTITFTFAVLVVLANLLADLAYGLLDPRIRHDD